uniref:G_PROTEIN_RECEP_F1_2 domain-containing protein n=1 Tax=Syphacia muris TaxID=451379 RepID=A0A0N5APD1_9BILA
MKIVRKRSEESSKRDIRDAYPIFLVAVIFYGGGAVSVVAIAATVSQEDVVCCFITVATAAMDAAIDAVATLLSLCNDVFCIEIFV